MFASKRASAVLTQHSQQSPASQQANRFHGAQHGHTPAGVDSSGSFLADIDFAEVATEKETVSSKTSKHQKKWRSLSEAMLKNNSWTSIRRFIDRLPKEIEEIYRRLEGNITKEEEKLNNDDKKAIYKEFVKLSSTSFGELHAWEIEGLLQIDVVKTALGVNNNNLARFNRLIKDMISKKGATLSGPKDREAMYDFEQFITIVYDILHQRHSLHRPELESKLLSQFIPIDPDHSMKQGWDIFIMVLLVYCSFEVPYTMAFSTSNDEIVPSTPFEVLLTDRLLPRPTHLCVRNEPSLVIIGPLSP